MTTTRATATQTKTSEHRIPAALLQKKVSETVVVSRRRDFTSNRRGRPQNVCVWTSNANKSVQELSPGAALCLYRIAQEALGNAAKYSEARKVEVRLTRSNGSVLPFCFR